MRARIPGVRGTRRVGARDDDGLAVDTARGYLVKTRLNYALDAAALAGLRVMFDAVARDAAIQDFSDANFPSD